jgi:hypothetical protein
LLNRGKEIAPMHPARLDIQRRLRVIVPVGTLIGLAVIAGTLPARHLGSENKAAARKIVRLTLDGRGRIRTFEGISHQIYSLTPLATWVHARL